jgi:hypothetical protein
MVRGKWRVRAPVPESAPSTYEIRSMADLAIQTPFVA